MKKTMIAMLCCVSAITAARAHAFLDHSDPRVGNTVHGSPTEVKIWFTERLILPFSSMKVLDASGNEVDKMDKHLDPSNGQLLIVSVPTLKAGKYKVAWRVTAVDTHVTSGTFTFDVSP
ncbi:MAG: copper resistance CopC family protein [Chthoniobacteraceae bacterium]|jgi:methionine-rich copper-binding protein CopC